MKRRTFAKILLLALLLTLPLPTMGVGAWFCEGRPCGVSLWLCCCLSPDDFRDVNCQQDVHLQETFPAESDGSLVCANGCNCQIMVNADAPCKAESPITFTASMVAVLLVPVSIPAPHYVETPLLPGETRGPPVSPVSLLPFGLRAPPVA